jgi:MOSC domain-containing protein YiiM
VVVAVGRNAVHALGKPRVEAIRLLAGLGVEGDAHEGRTVQHRSRVARDPTQPNLRQVYLIQEELLEALGARGFEIGPGEIGENVTTRGIDLPALPAGTRLRLGERAVVEVTGLRNPCAQLEAFRPGLMRALTDCRAGAMSIVIESGDIRAGDAIAVELPPPPYRALERV